MYPAISWKKKHPSTAYSADFQTSQHLLFSLCLPFNVVIILHDRYLLPLYECKW